MENGTFTNVNNRTIALKRGRLFTPPSLGSVPLTLVLTKHTQRDLYRKLRSPADASTTLTLKLQMTPKVSLPLPPMPRAISEATEDADAPTETLAAALEV